MNVCEGIPMPLSTTLLTLCLLGPGRSGLCQRCWTATKKLRWRLMRPTCWLHPNCGVFTTLLELGAVVEEELLRERGSQNTNSPSFPFRDIPVGQAQQQPVDLKTYLKHTLGAASRAVDVRCVSMHRAVVEGGPGTSEPASWR